MKDYVSAEAERILLADDYQDLVREYADLLFDHLMFRLQVKDYVTQLIREKGEIRKQLEGTREQVRRLTGVSRYEADPWPSNAAP